MIDMQNLIDQLQKWWWPIIMICILCGLALLVLGLVHFGFAQGNMGQGVNGKSKAIREIIIGILMINTPAVLETVSQTFLAQSTITDLSFVPPQGPAQLYVQLSIYVINLVGVYGVWKGLQQFAQHQPLIGKGFTYVIGGSMAVNFIGILKTIGNTFGGIVGQSVTSLIG